MDPEHDDPDDDLSRRTGWNAWEALPAGSGFEVEAMPGRVGLVQLNDKEFLVTTKFRFRSDDVIAELLAALDENPRVSPDEVRPRLVDALVLSPSERGTDLASIPPFMQWFERPYGTHTLAAILHDKLIVDEPNKGALASDELADQLFLRMLRACGTPLVKRSVMWAAVTIRTRWAADLRRRIMLVMWIAIALGGLACFVAGVVATIRHGEIPTMVWILIGATVTLLIVAAMLALRWSSAAGVIGVIGLGAFAVGAASAALAGAVPWVAWILILAALVLPVLSAALWGTQWRASLIAAAAGTFVIPAAFFALVGLGTYNAFEKLAPGGTRTTNPS